MDPINPFNALCLIADRENWCWKLYCTTCGTMAFRYGLCQIGQGVHPDDSGWINPNDGDAGKRFGDLRKVTDEIKQSANLYEILSRADLADLADLAATCRFPDFLGYLGVALFFTADLESQERILTQTWTPQLLKMVRSESSAELCLKDRLGGGRVPLRWSDLEMVEADFVRHESPRP